MQEKLEKIDVLNHGFVRLVDHMGNDLSIVRAARVSYDAAWRAGEDEGSDIRLINYLWKNKHTTPFESVQFTFEVKAPIFVFRQWHRHRTWSYNELSARYKALPEEYYLPHINFVGEQSTNNKQARIIKGLDTDKFSSMKSQLERLDKTMKMCFQEYHQLLESGWPRELARTVLPLATYSHMFASVNLLNLFKFLTLRCDEHAQYEIRQYANALANLIAPIVPAAYAAWESTNISEKPVK